MLSSSGIRERLTSKKIAAERRLHIVPVGMSQIAKGTLDLRLGTDFITTRRVQFTGLDVLADVGRSLDWNKQEFERVLTSYQDTHQVPVGRSFVLHPGQFALGSTLEYVRMPQDLGGYVTGRSSWGRLGLVVATATFVHPGFIGSVTL